MHMKKNHFSASFYAKFYSLKISFIANYKIALIVELETRPSRDHPVRLCTV